LTDRAEHVFPPMKDEGPVPVHSSRIINYVPVNWQAIHDLIAWCEHGVAPAGDTGFELTKDNAVVLAPQAAGRRGIQPVVSATANGGVRADVEAGETVTLEARAETPPGGGTIVSVEWDTKGRGDWSSTDALDGSQQAVTVRRTCWFEKPGTYFPAVRVWSHRDRDIDARSRRLPNIARVRVVVT
jgi:hypothetical protein